MTTEEDFQKALDNYIGDWQTRLVFADWLQERGDPRAEGYRALGVQRAWPFEEWGDAAGPLEGFWFWYSPPWPLPPGDTTVTVQINDEVELCYNSRRDAENAAALAFMLLPPERRAELLATPNDS